MRVFVFDLLPYAEHLEHLKEGRELPWPLPRRHMEQVQRFGSKVLPALQAHQVTRTLV
jgi:hypothetical protein